ncbi:L-fucose isomerase [uncultured Victivallis sp.]|uniref:L-fucose isomerase n=1 Tax=uncultured Victivallis sp. TaxID=354118 RepID=UPI003457E662
MTTLPKIGIRPTIDGRRKGIRESLEVQTMNMAKAAAELISSTLRYPNGKPVECIIADTTIGGVNEAAACAAKFAKENVTATLTVTPCWCYGSETMDMDPLTQKAVWGFNGTERPGAVYLAAVLAAHAQKGLPAFGIYGRDVKDATDTEIPEDVATKILAFARSAVAVGLMRGKSYLSMGSVAMGIAGSIVSPEFFEEYLNMRCESVDMSEIIRRVNEKIYDEAEYEKALAWIKANCRQYEDIYNGKAGKTPEEQQKVWEYVAKMAIIARDLMVGNPKLAEMGFREEAEGHNAIAAGFQGQRQWTDHMPNGDFLETVLNSSFDWNGIREAFVVATENDALNGVAMLFGHLLTGTASGFSDVRTYWSPEAVKRATGFDLEVPGMIHLINSGATTMDATGRQTRDGKPAMKPFWEITDDEAKACLDATTWVPANLGYFRGGGFSSRFLTRGGMPVTMSRINRIKGLGPVLQIAEGYTYEPPKEIHDILDKRTDPGWPTTWFVPNLTGKGAFKDVYSVMANWGANHGAFNYGHIGADLITLASMLRIPVCMHNVPEEKIFRPAVWNAFGMEKEGADYRACQALGPVYR